MIFGFLKQEHARFADLPGDHQEAFFKSVALWLVIAIALISFPGAYVWVLLGTATGALLYVAARIHKRLGALLALCALALLAVGVFSTNAPEFLGYLLLVPSVLATFDSLYFVFTPPEMTEVDRMLRRVPAVTPVPVPVPAPKAPGYSWNCVKCQTANSGELGLCGECGFPAFFDGRSA